MTATLFYTRMIGGQQVRAVHESVEAAKAQAEHEEKMTSDRVVDRIEDAKGKVVWTSPEDGAESYDATYKETAAGWQSVE